MVMYAGDSTELRRRALEERITAQRLVQMFDDDGDGLVAGTDLVTLESTMADADDIVTGILLNKGWSLDALGFLREDRQVIRAWASIAAQLAGERRHEWLNERGEGVYHAFGVAARGELKALARGELRSEMEPAGAGINPVVMGQAPTFELEFAPNPLIPGDRGKGGF